MEKRDYIPRHLVEHALKATDSGTDLVDGAFAAALHAWTEEGDQRKHTASSSAELSRPRETPFLTSLGFGLARICAGCCSVHEQAIINHHVEKIWPHFYAKKLEYLRQNPVTNEKLGFFELRLQTAGLMKPPKLHDINIAAQEYFGAPLSFECDIDEESDACELDFVLVPKQLSSPKTKPQKEEVSSEAIELDLHSISVRARIAVKIWLKSERLEYYFVHKPEVHLKWDVANIGLELSASAKVSVMLLAFIA